MLKWDLWYGKPPQRFVKLTHFNHGCPNRLSNFNTSRMQFQDVRHRRLLRRSQIPKYFLLEIKANCFHVIGVNVFPPTSVKIFIGFHVQSTR